MEKVRLIALDMDGTLLDSGKGLSQESIETLEKALDAGILVVPATGRTYSDVHPFFKNNARTPYAICSNGATIVHLPTGEILYSAALPLDSVKKIEETLSPFDSFLNVFRDGAVYSEKAGLDRLEDFYIESAIIDYLRESRQPVDSIGEWIGTLPDDNFTEKVSAFFTSDEDLKAGWAALEAVDGLYLTSSLGTNIEINDTKATKGQALRWLADHLSYPLEAVMACGDNGNDLDMLEVAGHSVAMGNAIPEAKEIAVYVTDTNDNHGVAKAILKYALGEE